MCSAVGEPQTRIATLQPYCDGELTWARAGTMSLFVWYYTCERILPPVSKIEDCWTRSSAIVHNSDLLQRCFPVPATSFFHSFVLFSVRSFLERCFLIILYSLDGFSLLHWQRHTHTLIIFEHQSIFQDVTILPPFFSTLCASSCSSNFDAVHGCEHRHNLQRLPAHLRLQIWYRTP